MATKKRPDKKSAVEDSADRKYRNFPRHTLQSALMLPQKIQDEMGGQPMNRLLLADALGMSPSSSNYRDLLSSSNKYGLTEGNEKSDQIKLTEIGSKATQQDEQATRLKALRAAALTPEIFSQLFRAYANKKLPSSEMLPKILRSQYGVTTELTADCAAYIAENGKFVELVREIGGSPHVLFDGEIPAGPASGEAGGEPRDESTDKSAINPPAPASEQQTPLPQNPAPPKAQAPKPIFIGHGKNKAPLQQLEGLLTTFQIPHKVVMGEPNLGRPIPQKVRDVIVQCGSAILIFTKDEKFFDEAGNEVWRPSENVVHELGATSYVYGDRIVIFKEKGLYFPTNFQSIGYIEFEPGDLAARTADLLKELIGFGLVKVTPTQ